MFKAQSHHQIFFFCFRIFFYKKEELIQGFEISLGSSGLEKYSLRCYGRHRRRCRGVANLLGSPTLVRVGFGRLCKFTNRGHCGLHLPYILVCLATGSL
jgi:hypothetical protein